MNISYRWLRELAPTVDASAEEVADLITRVAVPVDDVVDLGAGLRGIVIGRVAEVRPHPNADRLVICDVDVGADGTVQVVTGAPNVEASAFYPFVGVGGTLPGGQEIREAKLRGERSGGMLCSERELGLGRDQAGILRLHGEFEPGASFVEAVGLDDHRLALDVTTNRPDLLGHLGVAREVAPGGEPDLRLPPFPEGAETEVEIERAEREGSTGGVTVRIEDPEGCPRYMGVVVRGVSVGPSPEWLAARLRAIGVQPINNVVDATNYVLYELNQPLHAFDLARLAGPAIVVRRARKDERLRTLDDRDRKLDEEILVIADAERPSALAGVMGGAESEVGADTRDLFLECAYFQPARVRRARRKLMLDTDAVYRFERGIDPDGLGRALRRLADLIVTVAGGEVDGPAVDVCPEPPARRTVRFRPSRVSRVLGVEIEERESAEALEPLGFAIGDRDDDTWSVEVPSWRPDVEREADLIEEVARRYGYDRIPDDLRPYRPTRVEEDEYAAGLDRIRELFVANGFLEARTSPFTTSEHGEVEVTNPISERDDHLRRALLPGLLENVERNFDRQGRDVRLFEVATIFLAGDGGAPDERIRLAAAFTGYRDPPHWSGTSGDFDVWDLKWLFERAAAVGAAGAEVRPAQVPEADGRIPFEHPLVAVGPDGQVLGWAGRVRDDDVERPPWAGDVWGMEMEVVLARRDATAYRPLPVYPPADRDIALLVPERTPAAVVDSEIRRLAPETLEDVGVFDVYEGANLPDGMRSIAWRLRFRAPDRTLTDEEVDEAVRRIVTALEEGLNVKIRGG